MQEDTFGKHSGDVRDDKKRIRDDSGGIRDDKKYIRDDSGGVRDDRKAFGRCSGHRNLMISRSGCGDLSISNLGRDPGGYKSYVPE